MSYRRGLVLLLVVVLVVAGVVVLVIASGGSDDQQEAAYRLAADRACEQAYREIGFHAPPRPATTTEVSDMIRLSAPALKELDEQLHTLRPSDRQRADHRVMLQVATEQRLAMQRAQYEIEIGEDGQAIEDWVSLEPSGRRFDRAARNLKLKVCPTSPPQQSVDQSRLRRLRKIRRQAEAWVREGHVGPRFDPAPDGTQPRRGPRLLGGYVYLVPMDHAPIARIKQLAKDLELYLGHASSRIRIMPRLYTESRYFNRSRQQVMGDKMLDRLIALYPFSPDVKAVGVIGITDADLYFSTTADPFVLGLRDITRNGNGGWGIVSIARLDPRNQGLLPDETLFQLRLRKMAARYVGMFMRRATLPSDRPNSLFRPTVPSVDTLDKMTDRFCEKDAFPIASPPC